MEDLYEILEVSRKASPEIIEKAYKTLAKKYHPDVAKDKQQAEKMMKKINSAYEILSNSETRKEYDFNLEQEENRIELNNNNIDNNVDNNISNYEQYYNIQNNQNINNPNIYNNTYNSEGDYINNFSFFRRLLNVHLDKETKIFLLVIVVIIILMVIKLFFMITDLFRKDDNNNINNYNETNTNTKQEQLINQQEYEIEDTTPVELLESLFKDLKNYDFNTINTKLTNEKKLSERDIDLLNTDKKIYEYIIKNSEYTITNYYVTNKKAEITVIINRFDVNNAILQYSMDKLYNFEVDTNEKEIEKIITYFDYFVNDKISTEKNVIVKNTNEGWKIDLIISDILGIGIL